MFCTAWFCCCLTNSQNRIGLLKPTWLKVATAPQIPPLQWSEFWRDLRSTMALPSGSSGRVGQSHVLGHSGSQVALAQHSASEHRRALAAAVTRKALEQARAERECAGNSLEHRQKEAREGLLEVLYIRHVVYFWCQFLLNQSKRNNNFQVVSAHPRSQSTWLIILPAATGRLVLVPKGSKTLGLRNPKASSSPPGQGRGGSGPFAGGELHLLRRWATLLWLRTCLWGLGWTDAGWRAGAKWLGWYLSSWQLKDTQG